jgi:hypothetical protein
MVTDPASREFSRYAATLRAYGAEFGLTPASVPAIARGDGYQVPASADPRRYLTSWPSPPGS